MVPDLAPATSRFLKKKTLAPSTESKRGGGVIDSPQNFQKTQDGFRRVNEETEKESSVKMSPRMGGEEHPLLANLAKPATQVEGPLQPDFSP